MTATTICSMTGFGASSREVDGSWYGVEVRSVKETRATFRAVPGMDRRRPSAAAGLSLGGSSGGVGISNLLLAGDWCDTGWPATMEGAVRSGYAAAEAITGEGGVVPDVPVARIPRWLGLR